MSKERRLTMEYQVLAIKWLLEKGAQVEYIAGGVSRLCKC